MKPGRINYFTPQACPSPPCLFPTEDSTAQIAEVVCGHLAKALLAGVTAGVVLTSANLWLHYQRHAAHALDIYVSLHVSNWIQGEVLCCL